jgi:hypothetical protein
MRLIAAVLLGVVAGALYTVSPLAAWCVPLVIVLLTCAGRGLPSAEDHWLKVLLAVALAVRLAAIGAMFVVNIPLHDDESVAMLSGDEAYGMSRALRTRDVLAGAPVTQYDYFVAYDEYGRNSYIGVLTAMQILFGPTPYSMRLFNTLLFMTASVLLFRTARSAFGPGPAFAGLAAMLFLPTLFYWSISLLKEPLYLFGGTLTLTGAIALARTRTIRDGLLPFAAMLAGMALASGLRTGGFALSVLGIACGIALLLFFSSQVRSRLAAAAVVAALALAVSSAPSAKQRLATALESAAKTHAGHVFTQGHSYKLLDAGFYMNPVTAAASSLTLTATEAARYVIRAAISFVVVPLPWELASARELTYLPEQLLWYVFIVLFPVGALSGWKRDPLATALFAGFVVPTAAALALTNGNVGTLLRLRGTITPYVIWISAVGFCAALQRYASRTSAAGMPA